MSLAATRARRTRLALPEGIGSRGLALSGALHVVLIAILVFGLPTLFAPPPPPEMPIAVDLVDLGPQTRATHPNPNPPVPAAKPVVPEPGAIETKPVEKPAPPPPPAPPSAAAVPAPEPMVEPEPKPAPTPPPPLPQAKPVPPTPPVEEAAAPRPREKPPPPMRPANNEATQAKRYDPGRFDALLRNLAAASSRPAPQAMPERTAATALPSSQPQAPLGSRLSASEIDMVREQISRCWDVPAGARDDPGLVVEIRVIVGPDGNVEQAAIVDQAGTAGDPFYRAAAESARRAFFNPECRPLRLPPDKYEIWRDMVVDFSPKDLS